MTPMADRPDPSIPADVFFIDRTAEVPLQVQLREALVSAILARRLTPGFRLPSTRRLAKHLKVSRITVTLAYQELISQGYLAARARSAYQVSPTAPVPSLSSTPRRRPAGGVDWTAKLKATSARSQRLVKPLDWRRYPYPFIYGQVDMSLFDHGAWRDCARRAIGRRDFEDLAGDFAAADDPMLVNHICSRTLPRRGIDALPEEILVTVGAQNALWLIIHLLFKRGTRAVCENPGYPDLAAALRSAPGSLSRIDVDAHGLPPAAIPDDTDLVFVTPSHHSPTGVTMPMERRTALLSAANDRDFVVVEDDYEFEMSLVSPPSPALKSLDRSGRVLYVGSFSKALFPGLRLGYLVAPEPVIRAARDLRALMLRHPPGHQQRTVAYFLALGHYDALIQRMRSELEIRRETMMQVLATQDLRIAGDPVCGGTSFWVKGPENLDSTVLADEVREEGVLIEPGAPFFEAQETPCRYFRMGYSSISADRIPEGVRRTAKVLRSLTT